MIRYAMSRGYLVVDENILQLNELLRAKNFRTVVPPAGTPDNKIIEDYCGGRIIVTANATDFIDLAPIYEFGIIEIAQAALADPDGIAKRISWEFSQRSLRASEPFLLTLSVHQTTFRLLA